MSDRIELQLGEAAKAFPFSSTEKCLSYLGQHFRHILNVAASVDDCSAGSELIRRHIFVHLDDNEDKFNLLILMVQKLYALVSGKIIPDDSDSLANHECLLPGHLINSFVKEKLQDVLGNLPIVMRADRNKNKVNVDLTDDAYVHTLITRGKYDVGIDRQLLVYIFIDIGIYVYGRRYRPPSDMP